MKITFHLHYRTRFGEYIALTGLPGHAQLRLDYQEEGHHAQTIELADAPEAIEYRYVLTNDRGEILQQEGPGMRQLNTGGASHLVLRDAWRPDHHPDHPLYTSAFTEVIFAPETDDEEAAGPAGGIEFRLRQPRIERGESYFLTGNTEALGNWDTNKAVSLSTAHYPMLRATVQMRPVDDIEYKYGLRRADGSTVLETGPNRTLETRHTFYDADRTLTTDEYFRHPDGQWRGAGVAVPVFSLRGETTFGAGQFTDLKGLGDWAERVHLNVVQILPVNDTIAKKDWTDSYPYEGISVFALHPLYLDISAIDGFEKVIDQKEYEAARTELNAKPRVDYERTVELKLQYARQLFEADKRFRQRAEFKQFFEENKSWLPAYAAFSYLRDTYGTTDFTQWESASTFSPALLKKLTAVRAKHFSEIAFYYFLQYHLDRQLRDASDHLRAKGIVLKGDIPIGIFRQSVDAWVAPELYNMDGQSGAPPDPFSATGQNWGFPTYNWEVMAQNDFAWWKARLQHLSRYFDAFRIDHILGFFRIWQIPLEQVDGLLGFFNRAIPLRREEFAQWGIHFDEERFLQPYVRGYLLLEMFGERASMVASTFFDSKDGNVFRFKPEFDTQRKVEAWFGKHGTKENQDLRDELYRLHSNLLFMEVPGSEGTEFHPRILFQNTTSFQHLPNDELKHRLARLYDHYFNERQEDFWRERAMEKLPSIKAATNMLICGEDLGMVPQSVAGVMHELEFLTLEIQRMSNDSNVSMFLRPSEIPYWSVCSPSTHDMSPLRLWWTEMKDHERAHFYHHELGLTGTPPSELEPWIAKRMIAQHLHFDSMLAIFPLQDIVAMSAELRRADPEAERINEPDKNPHYWRYRFHLSNADLLAAESFNAEFGGMVARMR